MAEILYNPDSTVDDIHKCWKELPGDMLKGTTGVSGSRYYRNVDPGTVVLCSCGNVFRAKDTGYFNLGCTYVQLGWWESRQYKKKASSW